jgi:oligopeptide transport system substrate-binding protein
LASEPAYDDGVRTCIGWAALLGAALISGCGQGGFSQRVQAGKESTLRYAINANPTTLDPGIVQDVDTGDLINHVFEGLVSWGESNELKPQLAESWTVRDEGRTYVFKIRSGAQFHNGREVTAEDFKWSMERNLHPDFPSPTAENYLREIVGVREYRDGKASEVSGIQALDAQTLQITIDKPRPYFLGKLTYSPAFAMPREIVPSDREIQNPEGMIGTGPFRIERLVSEQVVVLAAFAEHYEGQPTISRIERPVIKDSATRLNKYRANELDLLTLERQDVEAISRDPKLASHLTFMPRPAVFYIGMNPTVYPPFRDVRVRRALAMGVDKDVIVRDLLKGVNERADGILPPGVLGHREEPNGLAYDPEAAKRLLAEAGYPGGKGLPNLELAIREQRPDGRIVAESVASQLGALGVPVRIRTMEWRSFLERRNRRELAMFHLSWYADYLDPENFLSFLFNSKSPGNYLSYENAEFDRLTSTADTTMEPRERLLMYAQAEDIVLRDAVWIPLYFGRDPIMVQPRVKGLRTNLFGFLPHTNVRLED